MGGNCLWGVNVREVKGRGYMSRGECQGGMCPDTLYASCVPQRAENREDNLC